ncbi:MAG: septal ring lytic transglycosylase RlpA family protein [Acidobacteriaceae bacterium]|nr:septal ring lytic transglycosylase RlpA family protein [Acidobacteriaceae bacterium]MBV9499581.1 septal ring lytic transglycosylase RlpA family protein [Acidobacteriaceae bacterium]
MMTRAKWKVFAATLSAMLLFSPGCGKKQRTSVPIPSAPQPQPSTGKHKTAQAALPVGYTEEGIASWYGVPFNGRQAADGEIYDMETLVAAHRLMPFNTLVQVTNLANGKSVHVRIIDRGPFVQGRILDLSKAAARQIDLLGPGVGRVRIQVIAAPADIPANDFFAVQVGAFSIRENAERLRAHYAERFGNSQLAVKEGPTPVWRVLVGKEPSIEAAQQLAIVLAAEDKHVFVVRLDQTPIANSSAPSSESATHP